MTKAMRVGEYKARQRKKYARLHTKQHPTTTTTIKETVINLSDQKLDEPMYSLLQKGLNFAVTPRSTPTEDILTGVEKAVYHCLWRWWKKPDKRPSGLLKTPHYPETT
jgi:hypothetical protein